MRNLVVMALATTVSACVAVEPPGGAPMPLINSAGQPIGTVRAWQTAGGVSFRVDARGLARGLHGLHVHAVGRCDPPEFTSAGPHWNPRGRHHGLNNPAGPHAGDLRNVEVAANGALGVTVVVPNATMAGLLDADGSALVLHASSDDFKTDPSGNSGARIACAVIRPGAQQL